MNPSTSPQTWQLTENERQNLKTTIDYSVVQSVPDIWLIAAQHFAQIAALEDPHAQPPVRLNYSQILEKIQKFAAGLQVLGMKSTADDTDPPRIALFADNSPRWLIADQGMMMAGGVNAVRSSGADREELLYILNHSGSTGLVVENWATLQKLRSTAQSEFPFTEQPIAWVVLLSDETIPEGETLKILNYSQLLELGANVSLKPAQHQRDTLATLIYTSGTTGKPKGVMLTHENLLHQISTYSSVFPPEPGDRVLSILPSWHVYERSFEYFVLAHGCTLTYTSLRHFKTDLKEVQPHLMVGVPRLWESIYEGVQKQFRSQPPNKQKLVNFLIAASRSYLEAQRTSRGMSLQMPPPSNVQRLGAMLKKLALLPLHLLGERLVYQKVRSATGGRIKFLISGGGSLAKHIDDFLAIVGVNLLVGYGLTETAPVLSVRRNWYNLQGSAGKPIVQTALKIVDPDTRQPLPLGERGLVLAKGPQIMRGYYRNPEATQKAIDPEGWFDTGDLGLITGNYDLVLTGRAKDTIVLSNGENIEPQPIEDACVRSPYIDQIMVVGQDQKQLGALIVPNLEALEVWANQQGIPIDLDSSAIQNLFRQELAREVKNRPGYRPDDRIGVFRLVLEPFSIDNGMMTQTLKIKRPVVIERYSDTVGGMFD
jgi:long-chain acyl-CoA synthetase